MSEHWNCPVCGEGFPSPPPYSQGVVGPVHVVDEGRYQPVVRGERVLIERADTAGAVRGVEEWPA